MKYLVGLLILTWGFTSVAVPSIRIATSADLYPYIFSTSDGCTSADGVCGFEADLFNAICSEMSVKCEWTKQPWSTPTSKTAIFDGLVHSDYDAIVDSVEASPERRKQMSFSSVYFAAKHLFVGKKGLNVSFDQDQFYPLASQPLKIATWPGHLADILHSVYPAKSGLVQILEVGDPIQSVRQGDVDLAFVFTGIESKLLRDSTFAQLSRSIPTDMDDPNGGTAAATQKSARGAEIAALFSEGLVRVRKNGNYLKISRKWMHQDIWNCKLGPQIHDPACASFAP